MSGAGLFQYTEVNKMIFHRQHYICVKQHDTTDCGPACLATVAKQYGLDLSLAKIRSIAGTDRQGTNMVQPSEDG